ncbi:MAG: hypothetical protein K2O35_05670, partial [Clostridia bacterium]|nr:hypothetical protein [Clostridia bacterium]
MNITTNSSDGLGEFNDGYTYIYTDKDLIASFRGGNPVPADKPTSFEDMTLVTVAKTSSNRGSQANPYVIATTDDWETFAKLVAEDTNKGSGKYFVLAADLDFNPTDTSSSTPVVFRPITEFRGTFYGLGHELKNIRCSEWKYWTGSNWVDISTSHNSNDGFSVFCSAKGGTFADIIVRDYFYTNIPAATKSTVATFGPNVGGLIGTGYGAAISILNCHMIGEIDEWGKSYATGYLGLGGVIGACAKNTTSITYYRCTTNTIIRSGTTTNSSATGSITGGICGEHNGAPANSVFVYDCVVTTEVHINSNHNNSTNRHSIVGFADSSAVIENVVGYGKIETVSATNNSPAVSSGSSAASKNVYLEVKWKAGNSAYLDCYPVSGAGTNINAVKNTASYTGTGGSANVINHSTTSSLVTAAKNAVGNQFNENIWNRDLIDNFGGYTPDNSPVRNYLMAFVSYRNLTNSGNSEESVGIEDGLAYLPGEELESQPGADYLAGKSSNQVFLGWTDDVTGESKPFKNLPSGMFGEVTLYAVWGLSSEHVDKYV